MWVGVAAQVTCDLSKQLALRLRAKERKGDIGVEALPVLIVRALPERAIRRSDVETPPKWETHVVYPGSQSTCLIVKLNADLLKLVYRIDRPVVVQRVCVSESHELVSVVGRKVLQERLIVHAYCHCLGETAAYGCYVVIAGELGWHAEDGLYTPKGIGGASSRIQDALGARLKRDCGTRNSR